MKTALFTLIALLVVQYGLQAHPGDNPLVPKGQIRDLAPASIMVIRSDHDSILFVIRPDIDTTALAPLDSLWGYPIDNQETLPAVPQSPSKFSPWDKLYPTHWMLRGTLLAGRGQCQQGKKVSELYAGAELTLLRHVRGPLSVGLTTGYYHSVGSQALHYMPWLAVVRCDLPLPYALWPDIELYGGLMHGIGRGRHYLNQNYPNCGLWGGRLGLNVRLPVPVFLFRPLHSDWPQNLWLRHRPTLSAGVNLGHISDNQSRLYPHTAEWILGVYGSMSISF